MRTISNGSAYPTQIATRCHCYKNFGLNVLVYLEFLVVCGESSDGSFWVVPATPRTVGEHVCGHVLDQGVENYAIAALADEWCVSL